MITLQNISLAFGDRDLFKNINIEIGENDKIGLVGKNGAGKTTLLKIILGELTPDTGKIIKKKNLSIGYLPQHLKTTDTRTVLEETLSVYDHIHKLEDKLDKLTLELSERTDYESKEYQRIIDQIAEINDYLSHWRTDNIRYQTEKVLLGLGFDKKDFDKPTSELSGGWRMRVELAKILLQKPDIFLLDEPTNHLDIESIQWLEQYLKDFKGAMLLISHDRRFLDNTTESTIEIVAGRIYQYPVSYSKFVELRKQRIERQMAEYQNQQKKIKETEQFIERFRYKATKASQVQSRIKQLEKMELIEIDVLDKAKIDFKFPPAPRAGDIVVELKELSKAYGNHLVLDKIDLTVERGEKIAFVGRNGEGKTTLAKIIAGVLDHTGHKKIGHNVNIGYYAQNQDQMLDPEKTVLETMENEAVGEVRSQVRNILGSFLFSNDDVDKKVKVLSGGERARLSLATLILKPYSLIILDEPTNHLDMVSKDILKQALQMYDGTLILVSHDRDFLEGLVTTVYHFKNKKIKQYKGGVDDFLYHLKLQNIEQIEQENSKKKETANKEGKNKKDSQQKELYLKRKELQRLINKTEKRLAKIDETLEELHKQEKLILQQIEKNTTHDEEIFHKYEKIKKEIEQNENQWFELSEELERLRNELGNIS